MDMDKKTYRRLTEAHAPHSPTGKNCANAFWVGGLICTLAQALTGLYTSVCGLNEENAGTLTSVTLVFVAVVLSAVGIFDRIAKVAGAGTLVPITGFANAVVSPAIDSHAEGLVLGVGAKIFTVAGPVILYGALAGAFYGVVEWIIQLF